MIAGCTPLGLIPYIASWSYAVSELIHAVLVQAIAGNAVIAKTPIEGGLVSLTIGFALARRCGLLVFPVSSGFQIKQMRSLNIFAVVDTPKKTRGASKFYPVKHFLFFVHWKWLATNSSLEK